MPLSMDYNSVMRKLSRLLFLLVLLCCLVSCATSNFNLKSDISIVIPRTTKDLQVVNAAKAMARELEVITGLPVTVSNDTGPQADNEISFGLTDRAVASEYAGTLRADDWCYAVSGTSAVVAGGNLESTKAAAEAFLEYVKSCDGVLEDVYEFHSGDYRVGSFLLGGIPIYEYTIVVPKLSGEPCRAATFLKNLILYRTGYNLSIATEASGRKILVGVSPEEKSAAYTVRDDNGNLDINGPAYMLMAAIRAFFQPVFSDDVTEISIALPSSPVSAWGNYENGFVLASSESTVLREGVTYTVNHYIDADDSPVVAYVLEVEKGSATLINATPENGYVMGEKRATTVEAMESAMQAGYDVIAGVNADFFRINEDGSPRGTCIKNSVVMQVIETASRSFFAVLDDCSYLCHAGAPTSEELPHIVEAVGGGLVLLSDGVISQSLTEKERHPRTVAGHDGQGKAILIALDGRQPKISNGAYQGDMALLLKDFGATDGINLDGGGSTTFVINEDGILRVKNSPSDGSLRQDYNSLVVVGSWL